LGGSSFLLPLFRITAFAKCFYAHHRHPAGFGAYTPVFSSHLPKLSNIPPMPVLELISIQALYGSLRNSDWGIDAGVCLSYCFKYLGAGQLALLDGASVCVHGRPANGSISVPVDGLYDPGDLAFFSP
jgi:hypothetical protein